MPEPQPNLDEELTKAKIRSETLKANKIEVDTEQNALENELLRRGEGRIDRRG